MSPALERNEKVRHRIPLPARVITSDEYFNLMVEKETEEKEKEEKKRREERAKKEEEKRQAQEAKRQKQQALPLTEDGEHTALSVVEWSHLAQEMRPSMNGSSVAGAICGSTWSTQSWRKCQTLTGFAINVVCPHKHTHNVNSF